MTGSQESVVKNIKVRKNKATCCVYGCSSKAWINTDLSYHHFPKSGQMIKVENKLGLIEAKDRRLTWEQKLKMGKKASNYMRVCSLHFQETDYFIGSGSKKTKRLKNIAFPSRNLPLETEKQKLKELSNQNRDIRRLRRATNKDSIDATISKSEEPQINSNISVANNQDVKNVEVSEGVNPTVEHFNENAASINNEHLHKEVEVNNAENNENLCRQMDKGVQVKTCNCNEQQTFYKTLKTDSELSTLTGISTFKVFNGIVKIVKFAFPIIEKHSTICIEDKVLMTYMKLRRNMSYAVLNVLFKCCTVQNCRLIILRMLDVLSSILQYAIPFPSRDEISKNIPLCFEKFPNIRASIDCTEVPTQRPSKLCCQMCLYSHYKGCYTTKIMTAVSPSGHLIYRSKAYGGRASDKAIFEQSGIIKLFDKGDSIMTDKGFLIDEICKAHDVNLIRPAFLKEKKQFSKEEAVLNASIAAAKVHVERYNQRIKAFQILDSKLPTGLIGKIDQIFTVVCGTINLSSPILKDDKFFE